jgi:hypothetical protein
MLWRMVAETAARLGPLILENIHPRNTFGIEAHGGR